MKTIFLLILLTATACVEKREIFFQANLVSMTKKTLPTSPLKKGRYINTRWCGREAGFAPETGKGFPAIIDQVISKAAKTEKADYFLDPLFYFEHGCITMTAYVGESSS